MTQDIIMYDSDEAATYKTGLSGWVSRDGHFFGDKEDHARYNGCTHKTCDCGNAMSKSWTKCDECRSKSADERYQALEQKEWAGEPIVLRDHESYFFHEEDLYDRMRDEGWESVDAYICEPNIAPYIEDYAEHLMPEDMYIDDVSPELANMIADINSYIQENKPVMSWNAGKFRTTITLPKESE